MPQVNWLLLVACVALVLVLRLVGALAAAYGFAVTGTMVITTILLGVVAHRLWRWSLPVTVVVIGFFLVVDVAFFAANAVKIPQGGWFPLLIGAVVFMLMSTWRRGRQIVLERTEADTRRCGSSSLNLTLPKLPRVRGTAVYLAAHQRTAPIADWTISSTTRCCTSGLCC